MLLDNDPHLTRDKATDRALFTHKGMAHFAGTGPRRMTCRQCEHWKLASGISSAYYSAIKGREIKPQPCQQFKRMMQALGPAVPHDAAACKYFVENPTPPSAYEKKRGY